MNKSVFIVGGGPPYRDMFGKAGWGVVQSIADADLVQFTGGPDVHPHLYGEYMHATTKPDIRRDIFEKMVYKTALENFVPMAGICRGGQFLNVMAGGKLWQNVDKHDISPHTHEAECQLSDTRYQVSSTHHQMMIPSEEAVHILHADESTRKSRMGAARTETSKFSRFGPDMEALFYPRNNLFCFQPHPEFDGFGRLAGRYFDFLSYLIFDDIGKKKELVH